MTEDMPSGRPGPSSGPSPDPPDPPSPPAPPRTEPPPPESSALSEYLRRRLDVLERELGVERDRSREAENLLRQQDALRAEADKQLKTLLEQLRQEKTLRENEEAKSHARGRIDALEQRLDEMHKTWGELLKEALTKREVSDASLIQTGVATAESVRSLDAALESLRKDLQSLRETSADVPAKILPELLELKSRFPDSMRSSEEERRILAENLRDMIARLGQLLMDRLGEMDRKLALEMDKHQGRLEALSRERALMAQTLEEERRRIRQEYAEEQQSLRAQFNEQSAGIGKVLADLHAGQDLADQNVLSIKESTGKIHALLSQPAAAKDQILQELEQEKRDLMKALGERAEQLRAYTLERREVERTLGDSLMELNRQLENERAKHQNSQSQLGDLQLQLQALQGQQELARKAARAADERFSALGAERDEAVKALLAESQKTKTQAAAKIESDKTWEDRMAQSNRLLEEEKGKRRDGETLTAELRAQLQTLTDHITQTLREKERAQAQASGWIKEREELLATLRKKDEMISMLSATFQNMLKK